MVVAVITRIAAQKNRDKRFSVYMDSGNGEVFAFSVDEDILVRFGLRKGLEFDHNTIQKIMHEDEINRAFQFCLSFLSYRMRSEKEVIHYMTKKQVKKEVIPLVIEKLKEHRYLDDREFAKSYVREKKRATVKGPRLLRDELFEKGIAEELINDALDDYPECEQTEAAARFAIKKSAQFKNESLLSVKNKIGQQLLQKGFDHEVIQNALNEIPEKSEEEEWSALKIQGEKAHRKYCRYEGFEYEKRMKHYLYGKGFSVSQIERLLGELQDQLNGR